MGADGGGNGDGGGAAPHPRPVVVNQLLMLQQATEAELRDEADKINGLLVKIDGLNRLNFAKDIHDKISSAHVRPHHCSNTPQMVLSDV